MNRRMKKKTETVHRRMLHRILDQDTAVNGLEARGPDALRNTDQSHERFQICSKKRAPT